LGACRRWRGVDAQPRYNPLFFITASIAYSMSTPHIYDMIQHAYTANALYVLTKHDIFERLLGQEKSVDTLAQEAGMDRAVLRDLLPLAAACGFLKVKGDGYGIAKPGLLLTRRAKSWLRSYLMVWGEQLNPAFTKLDGYATARTNAFEAALGAPIWDYYGKDKVQHDYFVEYMAQVTDQVHIPAIVKELKIGDAASLLDVGGGTGSLVCSLLEAHPALRGTIYDQPRNTAAANARIEELGLQERCAFAGGNMFASVPAGSDLYLIKHVLHDWDDANVVAILTSIAGAMTPAATLVLIEGLMDTGNVGAHAQFLHTRNIEQRVWTEGRVRSSAEWRELCGKAGLQIGETVDSGLFDVSYLYCKRV
jgi:hypothetical protein